MTPSLRALVRERAAHRCEYCRLHQDDSPLAALHIEHIRPRKHGGSDDESNLCLACIDCNLHKGKNHVCGSRCPNVNDPTPREARRPQRTPAATRL